MKGSRPFWVSLLHGFGRDSMSLTLPCDRPSTWNGNQGHVVASAPGSGEASVLHARLCGGVAGQGGAGTLLGGAQNQPLGGG